VARCSATLIACADANRWSAGLASAVKITCSNSGGMSGRSARGDGGGASTCIRSRSNNASATNGLRPVAHSNRITPIA